MATKKLKSADVDVKEMQEAPEEIHEPEELLEAPEDIHEPEELQEERSPVLMNTGETRDAVNDGEYNKYPVYHGCIRFDDDNIICAKIENQNPSIYYNNTLYADKGIASADGFVKWSAAGGLTSILTRAFFNGYARGSSATSPFVLLYFENSVLAFDRAGIYTLRITSNMATHATIYLKQQPANDAFVIGPGGDDHNITINCAFPAVDKDISDLWGFPNAVINFNVPYPKPEDVLL